MGNLFVANSKNSLSRGIPAVLIGSVFLFFQGLTIRTVIIIIGAFLLLNGLITIILSNRKKAGVLSGFLSAQGLINVIIGIVLITSPTVMVKVFMIFIGVILLLLGLLQLAGAMGTLSRSLWTWIFLIIALMTIACGVFLLSDPYKSAETILPFLGALLILNGFSELFMAWKKRHQPNIYKGSKIQDIPYEEV